jgi:hypothetical protein
MNFCANCQLLIFAPSAYRVQKAPPEENLVGKKYLTVVYRTQNTAKNSAKSLRIAAICVYGNASKVNENYPQRASGRPLAAVKSLCKTPIFPGEETAAEGKPESRFFCFGGFLTIWRVYVIIFAYKIRDESPILHYFLRLFRIFLSEDAFSMPSGICRRQRIYILLYRFSSFDLFRRLKKPGSLWFGVSGSPRLSPNPKLAGGRFYEKKPHQQADRFPFVGAYAAWLCRASFRSG